MTRSRRLFGAAAVAVLVVAPVLAAAPASAADVTYEQAQWYYDTFNMAANLAKANGSGVTIGVIDGSIDPSVPELAGAKIQVQPGQCVLGGSTDPVNATQDATHGTNVAVMLAGNGTGTWNGRGGKGVAPGANILYYRNATDRADGQGTECRTATGDELFDQVTANAIQDATAKGARVISMSFIADSAMSATSVAMGFAEQKGVVFVAGTDDKATPYSQDRVSPPGIFNGAVLVNAKTPANQLAVNSSSSPLVTVAAPGDTVCLGGFNPGTGKWDSTGIASGSSFATPWTAGLIADAMSRYPKATSNQILQLMLRTTGGSLHELSTRTTDGFGYGTPSLTSMYENDPSQFPDKNPLLRDGVDPPTAEILGRSTASSPTAPSSTAPSSAGATSPRSATPRPQAAARGSGSSLPLILGIVAAVLVVLAVLVAVVVLRSRRRPPGGGAPPGPGVGPPPPAYGNATG